MTAPVLLDCTLRDGGYYNNWDFDQGLVNRYLMAMAAARVNIVEIGFRVPARDGFYGPAAFSTDAWLRQLDVPPGIALAVMINAKDILTSAQGIETCLQSLFAPRAQSPVQWVRIAAHLGEVEACAPVVAWLAAQGYRIGFNIMQIAMATESEIAAAVGTIASWQNVDVVYFADSLGNMREPDISRVYHAFREVWPGAIGIHAHNNMNRALANTLHAQTLGVQWLDATVLGMGRGAGNTEIEHLLLELERLPESAFRADPVLQFIDHDFAALHRQYNWGPNRYYYLAGLLGVHPTYVQEMLSGGQYSGDDILTVLRSLDQKTARSWSHASLQRAILQAYHHVPGSWSTVNWAVGRTVMLLASGPQLQQHWPAIADFIARTQPLVLALNHIAAVPESVVDVYVACHPTRIRAQTAVYQAAGKPLLVPKGVLTEDEKSCLQALDIRDYGIHIEPGVLQADATGCTVSYPFAAAYALCALAHSGAERVLLCGFDGYAQQDRLQADMNAMFAQFIQQYPQLPLHALTPTTYNIPQRSIYMSAP
jgi:4-hydroxy 2-oxovalerate aldolase